MISASVIAGDDVSRDHTAASPDTLRSHVHGSIVRTARTVDLVIHEAPVLRNRLRGDTATAMIAG